MELQITCNRRVTKACCEETLDVEVKIYGADSQSVVDLDGTRNLILAANNKEVDFGWCKALFPARSGGSKTV